VLESPGSPLNPTRLVCLRRHANSPLADSFRKAYPAAEFIEVDSIREWLAGRRPGKFTPDDYNRRKELVFITSPDEMSFQRCPCTAGAGPCGYHVFKLSYGCPYDCAYCFLQEYVNTPGLFFPYTAVPDSRKLEAYLASSRARRWSGGGDIRIGTGEYADSLALDGVTGYSRELVEYFRGRRGVVFEFKTKSAQVDGLLESDSAENIVIGFSIAPRAMVRQYEFGTASMTERFRAARRCQDAGYRLAFHLDPVIRYPGWEEDYRVMLKTLFESIDHKRVAWISLGTLRFNPRLKVVMERRFPGSPLLDDEMFIGYDKKLRYRREVRIEMYRRLIEIFNSSGMKWPLYLCMEDGSAWREVGLDNPF